MIEAIAGAIDFQLYLRFSEVGFGLVVFLFFSILDALLLRLFVFVFAGFL